jgi:spermidine/putrescine transport system permease protein
MDVALSRRGAWLLRAFFAAVVVLLYAPIVVLLIFSFNDSAVPTFPLSGFTLRWYHQFLTNPDLQDALKTSAIVAALSSLGAVILGLLAAIALVRHPFRGTGPVSALLLSPLVIPFIVFGVSLLLLFHAVGVDLGVKTVVVGTHRDHDPLRDARDDPAAPADRRLARNRRHTTSARAD